MPYAYSPLVPAYQEIRLLTIHKPVGKGEHVQERINCSLSIHATHLNPLFDQDDVSHAAGSDLSSLDHDAGQDQVEHERPENSRSLASNSAPASEDEWATESDNASVLTDRSRSLSLSNINSRSRAPPPRSSVLISHARRFDESIDSDVESPASDECRFWEYSSISSRAGSNPARSDSDEWTDTDSANCGHLKPPRRVSRRGAPLEFLDFDALSYVWGGTKVEKPIYIDGEDLLVTTALHEILDNFRRDKKIAERYLWIDAVCVNQNDLEERNRQVLLMSSIYGNAKTVHFWLGQSTKESDALPELIQQIAKLPRNQMADLLLQDRTQQIVSDIMERRWWTRIWVVQEFAHARNTLAHIGDLQMSFRRIQSAFLWLLSEAFADQAVRIIDSRFQRYLSCLSVFANIRGSEEEMGRLENMMKVAFAAEATDPRDLVFGILSLLYRQLNLDFSTNHLERDTGADIRPDYKASVGEVYSEITAVRLRHDGSLDFLNCAGTYGSKYEGLSSWAVDLRQECASMRRCAECNYCPQSRVGEYVDTTNEREASNQLVIRAQIVDETRNIVPALIAPQTDATEDGTGDIEGLARGLDSLRASLRASLKASSKPEGSINFEFWKTVVMYDEHAECSSRRDKNETKDEKHVAFAAELDQWLDGGNSQIVESKMFKALDIPSKLRGRSFFTTKGGRIGSIDDRPIRVGDQIAVAVGSRAPLILRSSAGSIPPVYQLIGMAYVQDLMDGEVIRAAATAVGLTMKNDLSTLVEPITLR